MAKVDLETVQKILKSNGVDVRLAAEILNQLRDVVAEDAVEREKPAKKQMLVLVSEPEEGLPKDLTGWVVQLLEDDDPKEVSAKIVEVAKAFNESPKGQRVPVESFGDAVQSISGKAFQGERSLDQDARTRADYPGEEFDRSPSSRLSESVPRHLR